MISVALWSNESKDRGVPSAGPPPRFIAFSFSSMKRKRSTCSPSECLLRKSVSLTSGQIIQMNEVHATATVAE